MDFFGSVFFCIWAKYGDFLYFFRIQSEYRKIRTRKTTNLDTFHSVITKHIQNNDVFFVPSENIRKPVVFQYFKGL